MEINQISELSNKSKYERVQHTQYLYNFKDNTVERQRVVKFHFNTMLHLW